MTLALASNTFWGSTPVLAASLAAKSLEVGLPLPRLLCQLIASNEQHAIGPPPSIATTLQSDGVVVAAR